ncbi:unnamed protein product [Moneuplotes crassus]|uniref:Uncharacterized protein n=1 Tax=Euplotes crassus TaxID=5936 RepID=A0AAD1U420_EUPCR|nr:unnamed protein product [Moneuplotes crassus]
MNSCHDIDIEDKNNDEKAKESAQCLISCSLNKDRAFIFNSDPELQDIDCAIDEVVSLSSKAEKQITVGNFSINQEMLRKLFSVFKAKTCVSLSSCNINLSSTPDFGSELDGCTIEELQFSNMEEAKYGDWANSEAFTNLIKGLAKNEAFKTVLKKIRVSKCGLDEIKIKGILEQEGFSSVDVQSS